MKLDQKILETKTNGVLENHTVISTKFENLIGNGWRAIYQYPSINSRVCSSEVKEVSKLLVTFASNDISVTGISKDEVNVVREFSEVNNINHTLISDEDSEIINMLNPFGSEENRFVCLVNPKNEVTYFSISEQHVPRNFMSLVSEIKVQMAVYYGAKIECKTRPNYEL